MKVLIVEDEQLAVDRLIQLMDQLGEDITVVGHCDSVKSAVEWIKNHPAPELAFFDIQLADGLSFKIFEQTTIKCPIIFTTAYDQYAIQAFKVNSVDYLLKPISKDELSNALTKFKQNNSPQIDTKTLLQILGNNNEKQTKERFIIKVGEHLRSILSAEIAVFFSEDSTTFLIDTKRNKYILDYTLDHLEGVLDSTCFYRISRKFIIHIDCISDMITYSKSRLKIELGQYKSDELIVSRDRVADFKKWLDR